MGRRRSDLQGRRRDVPARLRQTKFKSHSTLPRGVEASRKPFVLPTGLLRKGQANGGNALVNERRRRVASWLAGRKAFGLTAGFALRRSVESIVRRVEEQSDLGSCLRRSGASVGGQFQRRH